MFTNTHTISQRVVSMPLFTQGFRPFFLGASVWAIVSLLAWVSLYLSTATPEFAIPLLDWHRHELLYGYVGAVIAGFLLTASANWTSRPPVAGTRLLLLFCSWLLARIVLSTPGSPAWLVICTAMLSHVLLLGIVGRELILARNYRNMRVLFIVALFAIADIIFLIEIYSIGTSVVGYRVSITSVLLLIMLIGGRVVPAFTRNWLKQRNSASLPAEFSRFDGACVLISTLALLLWSFVLPMKTITEGWGSALGVLFLLCALLNMLRLLRWQGAQTLSEPLVAIMHVAYSFIPVGFVFLGLSVMDDAYASSSVAIHVWTVGAITMMCMAIMTRASLGHMGQPLKADRRIVGAFLLLIGCVVARVTAGFGIAFQLMLAISAITWCLAHAFFIWCHAVGFVSLKRSI